LIEPPAALTASLPSSLIASDVEALLWLTLALAVSGLLATLRAALVHSLPARVLARTMSDRARARLAPLLERVDSLAASAGIYKIMSDLAFVALLIGVLAGEERLEPLQLGLAVLIAAPALLLLTEALPLSIARARGDALLVAVLPHFQWLQLPVAWVVFALDGTRKALLRTIGIRDTSAASRKLVEGLREVAEGASGELEESERELIENVLDFRDVDAAEVMTPRTEIHAVSVTESLEEAARVFAEAGHSRIPVYDESIDNIIGTVNAREVASVLAENHLEDTRLRDVLRPPLLTPETKLISELLREFRRTKQKMAIIVDEYGGAAGVVTLADVLAELVGEMPDEYEEAQEAVREVDAGLFEVQAGLHVSEVNEALDLAIPEEEDYETLAGFVLAEFGHFPKAGESFSRDEATFYVAEASDRRVLKVRVQKSA